MLGLLTALLSISNAPAQNSFSTVGQVINNETREPVPFATIFLSNSAFGSIAKENGTFTIEKIPPGKYELIVSEVGYQRYTQFILVSDSVVKLNISLKQKITELKEIVVTANRSDFDKLFPVFKRYFLGKTPNSERCRITNRK